jgi:hypothetical protein
MSSFHSADQRVSAIQDAAPKHHLGKSMIPKSGSRFSEKIMLQRKI